MALSSFAALTLYVQSSNKKDVHYGIEDIYLIKIFPDDNVVITTTW